MSRPKRRSLSERLNAPEAQAQSVVPEIPEPSAEARPAPVSNLVTLSRDEDIAPKPSPVPAVTSSRDDAASIADEAGRGRGRRRSPGDQTRHSYHASLYLPEEAQFALREIALVTRRPKPHDVMLEAMADLFERYNKGDLAAECRRRITSRDKAKA